MNLPGIGDPKELARLMEARGLIRFPTAKAAELQEAIAAARQRKAQPMYLAARVRDSEAGLVECSIRSKRRAMKRKPI